MIRVGMGIGLGGQGSVVAAAAAAVTVIASDTFTRANSGTLATAPTGQTWIDSGSLTFGVTSNKAAISGTGFGISTIECVVSNGTITADITWATNSSTGIIFRSIGAVSDRWMFEIDLTGTKVRLIKTIANSDTVVLEPLFASVNGTTYQMKVVLNGSSINCYVNDTLYITTTDIALQTASKHGIGVYAPSGTTATFDNYTVVQ